MNNFYVMSLGFFMLAAAHVSRGDFWLSLIWLVLAIVAVQVGYFVK